MGTPTGWAKLNSNGLVVLSPGLSSTGTIIRDKNETWLFGSYHHIPHASSLEAKLWELKDGLELVERLNLWNLELKLMLLS